MFEHTEGHNDGMFSSFHETFSLRRASTPLFTKEGENIREFWGILFWENMLAISLKEGLPKVVSKSQNAFIGKTKFGRGVGC